ncbi:hypothetical protein [Catenuloplanes japonicus]|uniref:hypothetical protein n=1 Tax=Catenuloplanes japonicus TaxID=33876 RepID=UPI0012F748DE|nr:hypothetical protein [Catenuloplanes japonicus]
MPAALRAFRAGALYRVGILAIRTFLVAFGSVLVIATIMFRVGPSASAFFLLVPFLVSLLAFFAAVPLFLGLGLLNLREMSRHDDALRAGLTPAWNPYFDTPGMVMRDIAGRARDGS